MKKLGNDAVLLRMGSDGGGVGWAGFLSQIVKALGRFSE
jgi:hypothetical protein